MLIFAGLWVNLRDMYSVWDVLSKVLTSLVPLYLAIRKSRLHVRTF